jgi:hypothetical protein
MDLAKAIRYKPRRKFESYDKLLEIRLIFNFNFFKDPSIFD